MHVALIPRVSCNIPHLCCSMYVLFIAPWQESKIRMHIYQILSACRAILFLFKEWMNLYVLQFLSAHEDEQGCPRCLRARVWRVGNEESGYCHQTKGCKAHLSVKESGERNLPPENVANSTFTTLKSFLSSKYRSKYLLTSIEISWSQCGEMRFGFSESYSMK